MKVNTKLKSSIQRRLEKIKSNQFNEDDVKLLLIEIRESISNESVLREFADFIAHPTRQKGIFNKSLNTRYLKLKLIEEQKNKLESEIGSIQTERQLSDFLLDSIKNEKIEKKVFEILFLDGLDDIGDSLFNANFPKSKNQVRKLISENYELDNDKKFYILKSTQRISEIDNALKFIRGTIEVRPIFSLTTFENELFQVLNKTVNNFELDKAYLVSIKENIELILLCILCLLHDTKFVFHDGHIGSCYLSIYPSNEGIQNDIPNTDSFIALISDDINVHMPIFVSNIKIGNLIPENEISLLKHMEKIKYINCIRNSANIMILAE